jgi:PadR family transcriptional regulator, regulatory protein PadR
MDEKLRLGDFEGVVLKCVHANGQNAYGVPIRQMAEEMVGRTVSIGAVYTTLDRLEEKGYVRSWEGEPDARRGGRRKRFYVVEGAGLRAMEAKALDVQKTAALWGKPGLAGGAN